MQDPARLCMQPGDADVLTFAPVVTLRASSRTASPRSSESAGEALQQAKPAGKVQFAVLGLANMLNSGACISRLQRNASSVEGMLLVFCVQCRKSDRTFCCNWKGSTRQSPERTFS